MELKKNPNKDIHRKSRMFFQIGLCVSITLAITAFEWRTTVIKIKPRFVENIDNPIILIPVTEYEPKAPPIPSPEKNEIQKPVIPTIISSDPIILSNSLTDPVPVVDPSLIPSGTIIFDTDTAESCLDCITSFPEKKAEPVGGYEAFYAFVRKNLKYPQRARKTETQGTVFVEFIVNRDGTPTDFKILKGIGAGCDEEAQRVIGLTKWNAGKQRGKPVRVKMVLPIQYRLN